MTFRLAGPNGTYYLFGMKSIFEPSTHAELVERLGRLTPEAGRQWGKMTAGQMMEHSARVLEMATGIKPMKQLFIGKAIGWVFRGQFTGEKPFSKNSPTGPTMIIDDEPDFEATRERLNGLISHLHTLGESGTDGNIHGFFGPLTGKQWGETQYKHVDHHLRQFGL
ncbi:MAG TPA: DUF1569 domain-containing protein [Pyrinomonadaceae bacterium]|nr:DUF1569 domain-containing protein [Pyrinomonadaceae bacterium]